MTTPEAQLALPENIPQVHFDTRLANYVQSIEFDYDEYIRYLKQQGLSKKQIHETDILFLPDDAKYAGGYLNRKIKAAVPERSSFSDVNEGLLHETTHRIDDKDGELSKMKYVLFNIATKLGMKMGEIITPLGIGQYISDKFFDLYYNQEHEKRAREAARQAIKIVSLSIK